MFKKLRNSRTVYKGSQFSVESDELELPNGRVVARDTVRHPGAVVILPITQSGKFLLVEQYRHSVGQVLLECPAGTLEKNEVPLDCAKREIKEEVGMSASSWVSMGTIFPAPGFCDEVEHLFVARGLSPSKLDQDEDEFIEVKEFSLQQLRTAVSEGQLQDAKSLALILRAAMALPELQGLFT